MRPAPDEEVRGWVAAHQPSSLYTTAITQAEILLGIEVMPKGKRRADLMAAAEIMFVKVFAGRILPFDSDAARVSAEVGFQRRRLGRPIGHYDLQIAAIARSSGAAVATRDTADFAYCGITVIDPWAGK